MVQIQMEKASDVCDDVVNTPDTSSLPDVDNSKATVKNEIGRALMKREIGQQARKIDLDNSNDNNKWCTIKSIIYLNDGRVVAFDEVNKSAKVLGTDFSIQMSYRFNIEPVDMCLASDCVIVVVFKNVRSVVTYRIREDQFVYDGEFTTKLNALSIASYDEMQSTVAILFSDEKAGSEMNSKSDTIEVQIRKYTDGHILQTFTDFESRLSKELVIKNPNRICVIGAASKQILIAVENKLYCFDIDESTLKENWFYKGYKGVKVNGVNDIATDSDGNVYIVCLESQNIHQISATNFRTHRVLTSKLKDPMSLCLDRTGSTIYVGCEEDDYLHVYQFV